MVLVDEAVGFWDFWISGLIMEDRERVVVDINRARVGWE